MSIDAESFKTGWLLLCERWGKEFSSAMAREYFALLDAELSTGEFVVACRAAIRDCDFFPSARWLIEAVRPAQAAEAADDWTLCQRVMAGDQRALGLMTAAGQRTVAMLGGPHRLGRTLLDEVAWTRREFLRLHEEAWRTGKRERLQLPIAHAEFVPQQPRLIKPGRPEME